MEPLRGASKIPVMVSRRTLMPSVLHLGPAWTTAS